MAPPNARAFRNPGNLILAVCLSLLIYTAFFAGIYLLAMLFLTQDRHYGIWFLATLGGWLGLIFLRYLLAHSCVCPLCRGPLMKRQKCGMHERARRHLGFHYRTSMMIDIVLRRWFCCPYCGTFFRLKK